MKRNPQLSIVTPSFNQGDFIRETFESILSQRVSAGTLEYIVVDGNSTDQTDSIVHIYTKKFKKAGIRFVYIRENDRGQSDAINKGWRRAKGNIVAYINSDDFYEKHALTRVLKYFQTHHDVQWAYGGWNLANRTGSIYSTVTPTTFNRKKLLNYCNIGQPSCFFRRKLLNKFGYLDTRLHLAFDYDLWLRFSTQYAAGIIPAILSNMRYYAQAKSASKTKEQLLEILRLGTKYTTLLSWRRISQYFYFIRGHAASVFNMDISKRIMAAHLHQRSDKKVIALVDPLTGGHHDMYLRLYSKVLMDLGYAVWVFTPNANVVRENKYTRVFLLPHKRRYFVRMPVITFVWEWFLTLERWTDSKRALKEAVRQTDIKPDVVFFLWLDSYIHPFIPGWLVDPLFDYHWSGLYFHPRHLRIPLPAYKKLLFNPDRTLQSHGCFSVSVLDEGIADTLEIELGKPVVSFPDVTDISVGNTANGIIKKIRRTAHERIIIGLFGSMEKRKCILEYIQLANSTRGRKFYFIFAGPVYWNSFSKSERLVVRSFIRHPPENCSVTPAFIPSEQELNSLIQASDVISVLYKDFPHSSNFLTKAVYFHKPVIGVHGTCIGERIEKYKIGVTLKKISSDEIHRSIFFLTMKRNIRPNVFTEGCNRFRKSVSLNTLQSSLKTVVESKII